ncbi:wall-associated receptor kinase 2-like [Mercurialis annua]|uniref:wall-associated receptor kinase 2-like n=1 Tax=Mercurialis annua TaxID=3986 RepID=UPI00215F5C72|nr:wall-associated receptor kinase 2-like [Mercurialis annua]
MAKLMHIVLALSLTVMACSLQDCPTKCGDVEVPYPFGVSDTSAAVVYPACARSDYFMLSCNSTEYPPRLYYGKLHVLNISLEEGTFTIATYPSLKCYNESAQTDHVNYKMQLGNGPFRLSDTRNKLTAIGCDTTAFMSDAGVTYGSGCISYCTESKKLENYCTGIGCCQTSMPRSLKNITIAISSLSNHSRVFQFNPCGFAFIADEKFNVSKLKLDDRPKPYFSKKHPISKAVIEWVASEETCEDARLNATFYACGNNTDCVYSENGKGYRCLCMQGYAGNPYDRLQGCQDIDECKEPMNYRCHGTCKNKAGNYTCQCPLGMHGDGKISCQGFHISTISAICGAFMFVVIISLLTVIIWRKRIKEKNFLKNGGMLLKHQRVRLFSEKELQNATKDYDRSQFLGEGGFGCVYKGNLADGTQLAVKKPKDIDKTQINEEFEKEIGIVSQVNHVNVVKILGLCLETKHPLLVYEFISNGSLYQHIHQRRSHILSSWKSRLRIAAEIALALDYLHSLANPPIIHGDVKSANILLDENYTAKVSDFGASVLISPGETVMATKIQGTLGYLDPEYLMTGILTEKSDVYSFGVVLVELLTGEKPNSTARSGVKNNIIQYFLSSLEQNNIPEILCLVVTEDEIEDIKLFAELAKCCLSRRGAKRPSMKQVADELSRLRQSNENLWAQLNRQESEHLVVENINQPESISMPAFDISL